MKTLVRLCFSIVMPGLLLGIAIPCTLANNGDSPGLNRLVLPSPDGKIEIALSAAGPLSYALNVDGQPVLLESKLGLQFLDGAHLGQDVELLRTDRRSADSTWENRWGKRRLVRDRCNELRLVLREKSEPSRTFEVLFRAFDDGVGFRYVLPDQAGMQNFVLSRELTEFAFADNVACYAGQQEKGFQGRRNGSSNPAGLPTSKPNPSLACRFWSNRPLPG